MPKTKSKGGPLLRDLSAKSVVEAARNDPDAEFALELSLHSLLMEEINGNRVAILKKLAEQERQETSKHLSKYNSALMRTLAKHQETFSKDRVWVDEYERDDGVRVQAHWRGVEEGSPASRAQDEATREEVADLLDPWAQGENIKGKEPPIWAKNQDVGTRKQQKISGSGAFFDLTRQGAVGDALFGRKNSPGQRMLRFTKKTRQAAQEANKKHTAHERIGKLLDFFSNDGKDGRMKTASSLVSDYGGVVGMRMIHAYRRYTGQNMPVERVRHLEGQDRKSTVDNLVEDLKKRLPQGQEIGAIRRAGARVPSEGFIVDGEGNIKAHNYGTSSDWFLPFSLSSLRKLRNSDNATMVRRRAWGGITSEDLHAGMALGADKITVISRSGRFDLNLADRSKGLSIDHARILTRYNDLIRQSGRNYHGYKNALGALKSEFPLNFDSSQKPTEGMDLQGHDPHMPQALRGELANLFNYNRMKRQRQEDIQAYGRGRSRSGNKGHSGAPNRFPGQGQSGYSGYSSVSTSGRHFDDEEPDDYFWPEPSDEDIRAQVVRPWEAQGHSSVNNEPMSRKYGTARTFSEGDRNEMADLESKGYGETRRAYGRNPSNQFTEAARDMIRARGDDPDDWDGATPEEIEIWNDMANED